MPQYKVDILLLIHKTKGCFQSFTYRAQQQSSSGHSFIENASPILGTSSQIMEPMPVATQPRPAFCYKLYMLLLMQ
jgi:hypothetical protein